MNSKLHSSLLKAFIAILFALALTNFTIWALAIHQGLYWRADFTIFYTASKLIREGFGNQLYNLELQGQVQRAILEGKSFADGLLPFNYPPYFALLTSPLSLTDLKSSYVITTIGQLLILFCAIWLVVFRYDKLNSKEKLVCLLAIVALPFFKLSILLGSLSLVLFAAVLLFEYGFRTSNFRILGIATFVLTFKPQYVIFPLVLLLAKKNWRALVVAATLVAVSSFLSSTILGIKIWQDYFDLLIRCSNFYNQYGIYPGKMVNLKGLMSFVASQENFSIIVTLSNFALLLGIAGIFYLTRNAYIVGNSQKTPLIVALVFTLAVFLSPHTNPQDALLYAPPAIWVFFYLKRENLPRKMYSYLMIATPLVLVLCESLLPSNAFVPLTQILAITFCIYTYCLLKSSCSRAEIVLDG